jgi:hypothetical protein
MARRLTPGEKQHILKRYREGASLRAIGREIGRPDITVRRILEAQGVTFGPPKTTNQRTSPETEALVLRLYSSYPELGITAITKPSGQSGPSRSSSAAPGAMSLL